MRDTPSKSPQSSVLHIEDKVAFSTCLFFFVRVRLEKDPDFIRHLIFEVSTTAAVDGSEPYTSQRFSFGSISSHGWRSASGSMVRTSYNVRGQSRGGPFQGFQALQFRE